VPLVGVVVAAYEAERYLGKALQSLVDQTHIAWACVVVDDGSSDATAHVAARFCDSDARITLHTQKNAGESMARNAGLARLPADVEYVCFLDSDDLLLPDALAVLIAALADHPEATGASGWAERIDAEGRPIEAGLQRALQSNRPIGAGLHSRMLRPDEDTSFETLLLHGSVSPPATALVRRNVADRIGGFAPELTCRADGDFWLRVARVGPLTFVDRQVAWYRRHATNLSADTATCLRMHYVVRWRTWASPDNTPAQRRAALMANVRGRTWDVALALRRTKIAFRRRRPLALAWSLVRMFVAGAEMAVLRPVVPPQPWVTLMVRLDRRCGFDPSGGDR
jgi:glycosyltransferase involved in cell wall biosynthesis